VGGALDRRPIVLTHRSLRRPAPAGRTRARRGLASASLFAASALAIAAVPPLSGANGADDDATAETTEHVRHASVRAADAIVVRGTRPATATQPTAATVAASADADAEAVYLGADGERIDVDRIRDWLEGRGSPLAPYAVEFVVAGVAHDVDPRVVLGIAGIESTVGEELPEGSHNAWGWNGDGPLGLEAWNSWPEAIDDYTERLGRLFDTDNVDEDFAQTYCPPNWEQWLKTVRWVIDDI
jgi:hypothetical protein